MPESSETDSLKREISSDWGDSNQGLPARLFALGYDSYRIIPELSKLRYFPSYRLSGLSGQLVVNEQGHVLRNLPWAKFVQGKVEVTDLEGPNVALIQENNSP